MIQKNAASIQVIFVFAPRIGVDWKKKKPSYSETVIWKTFLVEGEGDAVYVCGEPVRPARFSTYLVRPEGAERTTNAHDFASILLYRLKQKVSTCVNLSVHLIS